MKRDFEASLFSVNSKSQLNKTQSILKHLGYLFNTRKGTLTHLPEYGLPDVVEIYQNLPHSLHDFVEAVRKLIIQYECRLTDVHVQPIPIHTEDCVIRIQITANLISGGSLQLESYFMSGGAVSLKEIQEN